MIITLTSVSPPNRHSLRTFVREKDHQVAVDPELAPPTAAARFLSPGLSLVTAPAAPANKPDYEKICKVVESSIWPIAKETMPFSNSTVEGVEIVFAGRKLWNRITNEDGGDRVQVALAATDLGLELYDLLSKFVPTLQVAEPYRAIAGLIVNGTDSAYAVYVSKEGD